MGKIICDVCGTSYPDTAEQCPICGCTKESAAQMLGDEIIGDEEVKGEKSGKFSLKKRKEIFDFDEVNTKREDPEDQGESVDLDDDEDEETDEGRPNTFLIVILTILIVVLLLAAGVLYVRYIRPNKNDVHTPTEPTFAATIPTSYRVPCETLVLSSGNEATLSSVGGMFLLHVNKIPADSTDEIIYTSADESIATVTADGRVEAVAEGQTTITITCGEKSIPFPVTVDFSAATEPSTEATAPSEPSSIHVPEVTVAIESPAAPVENQPIKTGVTLKLKQKEFSLPRLHTYHTLQLDCDLDAEDVQWSTEHSYIATVDKTGKVTAVGYGVTDVIVKYGDQEVRCKVRCG